ncbi:MAG: T9SS type A sorting domain-containing protein [Ignavibacteriaceae bacterium]
MKKTYLLSVILLSILFNISAFAQYPLREDVIWARNVGSAVITLDGLFNEPEWAQAEKLIIKFGQSAGLPTSGWRAEFQPDAVSDPLDAEVMFLVKDNQLYLGFMMKDSSIGGTADWARWDAILMSLKDKIQKDGNTKTAAPVEYFYTYWLAGLPNTTPVVGAPPRFVGRYGNFNDTTRTPEQIAAWDARTVIHGISNDNLRDSGYDVEMRVDLGVLGYDATKVEGDVVGLNFSIWDADYLFEGNPSIMSCTRTHWQSPWGNANANNVGRICVRPDVTVNSVNLPVVAPDVIIPNGDNYPDVTIDGKIDETVWSKVTPLNIAWGDTLLRSSYPGAGALMSGEFQPELSGNPRPPVLDPSNGEFKMFFKGKYLYVGAKILDQVIQGTEVYDAVDGFSLIVGHRTVVNAEEVMEFKLLRMNFNSLGQIMAYDALPNLVDTGKAQYAAFLLGSSTVNNKTDIDEGFSIELKLDLTGIGYEENLGDKLVFAGIALYDGDSFDDSLNNYGTRTWWYREHAGGPATAWMVLDPLTPVSVDDIADDNLLPASVEIKGNYPNPFNPSTKIIYSVPQSGFATLVVFNSLGESIKTVSIGSINSGINEFEFNSNNLSSGVYFYKIIFNSEIGLSESRPQKMIYLK